MVIDLYVKTLSGRLQELKNKGEVQLGNPKSGRLFTEAFQCKV